MTTAAAPTKASDQKRAKAYAAAERTLREAHADEFAKFYEDECRKAGIAYKPRLTPVQKAKQTIDSLLAEFPELRAEPLIDFPAQD